MSDIIDEAIRALGNEDVGVRYKAVDKIGFAPVNKLRATAILVQALQDTEEVVRRAAVSGLMRIRPSEAIPTLSLHALSDPDRKVRSGCIYTLASFKREELNGIFKKALLDSDATVEFIASTALCDLGDCGPLHKVLSDPDWKLRKHACDHLIRRRMISPDLLSVLNDLKDLPESQENDRELIQARSTIYKEEGKWMKWQRIERTIPEMIKAARRSRNP